MKNLYIICKGMWKNKGSIIVLMTQIMLMCLIFNILSTKFAYVNQSRKMIKTSKLDNAVLFMPAERFCNLIGEKTGNTYGGSEDIYNSYYEMKTSIAGYQDITAVGTVHAGMGLVWDTEQQEYALAGFQVYDTVLLESLFLPLREGKLRDLLTANGTVPLIVSSPLSKMYGLGSQMDVTIGHNEELYKVKTTVIGVLQNNYCYYTFPGGNIDSILLSDLVEKRISHSRDFFCILPPFGLDDDNIIQFTAEDPSFICFFEGKGPTDFLVDQWNNQAETEGLGKFITFEDMDSRERKQIIIGNRSFISLGLIVALISLIGISGYNILQMLKNRQEIVVYLMHGMDWPHLFFVEMACNAIIVLLPAVVALGAVKVGISAAENTDTMLYGPLNLIVTSGICAAYILVSMVTVLLLYRDRSLSSLMRRDEK
ncbi:MAG: hypothetical protein PHZ11_10465 [Desulfitobacteriaceae bacterium]|nr:hypothetical protein [Desulfitobacteriaceae bacterium]